MRVHSLLLERDDVASYADIMARSRDRAPDHAAASRTKTVPVLHADERKKMKRKRKMTRAQRKAALKNLAKARRARRAGEGVVHRTKKGKFSKRAKHVAGRVGSEARRRPRKHKRHHHASEAPRKKKKKGGGSSSAKRTAAQKRYLAARRRAEREKSTEAQKELLAAIRSLKAAVPEQRRSWRRKKKKKSGKKKKSHGHKKSHKKSKKHAKRKKGTHMSRKKSKSRKKGHKKGHARRKYGKVRVRLARKKHRVSIRLPAKKKRGPRYHVSVSRGRRRVASIAAETHRRRRHAFDNPMEPMETGIAFFTSLVGYGAMSFGRRWLAAHRPEASGSLPGVMAAELAPMDWKQWLLGAVLTGGPLVGAHFVKNVPVRSVLTGFGFGAGIATLGKALDDGIAKLAGKTQLGGLLYAPEISGAAMLAPAQPKTGAGGLPECTTCGRRDGLGRCCKSEYGGPSHMERPPFGNTAAPPPPPTDQGQPPPPPPFVPPAVDRMTPPVARRPPPPDLTGGGDTGGGGGTPIPPGITASTPGTNIQAAPPSIAGSSPVPAAPAIGPVRINGAPKRVNIPNYNWGSKDEAAE